MEPEQGASWSDAAAPPPPMFSGDAANGDEYGGAHDGVCFDDYGAAARAEDDLHEWDQEVVAHTGPPPPIEVGSELTPPPNQEEPSRVRHVLENIAKFADRTASYGVDAALSAKVAHAQIASGSQMRAARDAVQPTTLGGKPSLLARFGFHQSSSVVNEPDEADLPALAEPPGLRKRIQQFEQTSVNLEALLPALEDYQHHRAGLADAEKRLCVALQQAGQRARGSSGEALVACGGAHYQAAARRLEAHAAEELNVVKPLRSHRDLAAADATRAVRDYEHARYSLRRLQYAREQARYAKRVMGDNALTPVVDTNAQKAEDVARKRLDALGDTALGKIAMFEAKNCVDYATVVTFHMNSAAKEEHGAAEALSGLGDALRSITDAGRNAQLSL